MPLHSEQRLVRSYCFAILTSLMLTAGSMHHQFTVHSYSSVLCLKLASLAVILIERSELKLETNLDDIHRSKSVLDYNQRYSRRDGDTIIGDPSHQHSRSKSADYLMDRRYCCFRRGMRLMSSGSSRIRDGIAPPENELQKTIGDLNHQPGMELSEHELRYRKSTERIGAPEWWDF